MPDANFALLDDRGVLAVSGADNRVFLQGLVSNDIDKVGPARARYAALLTAQGKYLHDFMTIEAGEAIWLEAEAGRLGDLKRRLSTLPAAGKGGARREARARRGGDLWRSRPRRDRTFR